MFKKLTGTVIALSMTLSVFSALLFTETASAEIINGVSFAEVITEDFEDGQQYIESVDSGLRTMSDKDGYDKAFSSYTNNSGESMGVNFKRIEQGNGIPSRYVQTRPSLVNGYDTSGIVRIDFDMAKSYATTTVTVVAVQGNLQSGTTNSEAVVEHIDNEQWLFSFEDALIYGYNTSSWPTIEAHTNKVWDKFSLVINCATDTYDLYRNGTKIINGYGVGVDFNSINSFKVLTKPSGPSGKTLETLIDNIRFYAGSSESNMTQVFYEDFEDAGMKVLDNGDSGYKTVSDNDGNNVQISGYTNNTGDNLGNQFKCIEQGNNLKSKYIQTRPALTSGFDTSGKVKFEFDMAKSNTQNTITVIAVQGDLKSGTTNSESGTAHYNNEQWLFSVESNDLWAATPTINNDWTQAGTYNTPNTWDRYTLIIDTDTDTYDMYINGVQKTSGYGIGVDFNNIDSLKIITKKSSSPSSVVETLVDNIGFYKETAPDTWSEIFFEDFEASDKQFIESGNSGYRLPTDRNGNGMLFSNYPGANTTQFKRLEQGNGSASKYIQTDPALLAGYDTSVVKVEFDMAMSETFRPETIIGIQGTASGSTNSWGDYLVDNEQWLFSITEDQIWAFDGSDSSWPDVTAENSNMKQKWYHFKLIVNCDTDTYEVWYNNDKVVDGLSIGRDYSSIDSFKIVTKKTDPYKDMKKFVETTVDNIVVSVKNSVDIAPAKALVTVDDTTTGKEFTDLSGNEVTLTKKYGIAKFTGAFEPANNDYYLYVEDNTSSNLFDIDFNANNIEISGTASFFAIVKSMTHDVTLMNLIAVPR